jgi:hypothetical protein
MKQAAAMAAFVWAFGLLAGGAGIASAATLCDATTYPTLPELIEGNVVAGPGCVLMNKTVTGSIRVDADGGLIMGHSSVGGEVKSAFAFEVWIYDSVIGDDVTLGNTNFGTSGLNIERTTIKGDLFIRNGTARVRVTGTAQEAKDMIIEGDVILRFAKTGDNDLGVGDIVIQHADVGGFVYVADNKALGSQLNVITVNNNKIAKTLEVDNNIARGGLDRNVVQVFSNQIGMTLEMDDNLAKGAGAQVDISDNTGLDGAQITLLACYRNTPNPTISHTGVPNNAASKKGQCEKL